MNNCIFCKIVKKEIPSKVIFENEDLLAFNDVNAQAPIHILLIPKIHRGSLLDVREGEDDPLMVRMFAAVVKIAQIKGIDATGFRLVANTGHDGGQTVSHLHFHLLGGRRMNWPPG
ncbi:MAG: histidine triad nucleotide-binding protein [Nitrospiria bacterium]